MRQQEEASLDPPRRVRCAVYSRRAVEAARDQGSGSIERQRERAAAYVESRRSEGLEVHPERYDDRGFSGANIDRPGLRRLLHDAKAGKFEMVVVCEVARVSRNLSDLLRIVEVLDDAGVSLAALHDSPLLLGGERS